MRQGGRRDRKVATARRTSLPASAQECAASARIDADLVTAAATDFATATSTLAPSATNTVVTLSDPPVPREPGTDPNSSPGLPANPAGTCSPSCSCLIRQC